MSNTIQPSYGTQTYSAPTKARETKQTGTQGSSFMDMAAQASRSRADTFTTGLGGLAGMAAMPTSLMMDLAVRSGGQVQAGGTEAVEAPSLETMLKAKYPNIHYHVFDASSGYWRTRNDYPHYLLYQDGDKAKETLENWQPTGANPFYGSIDGRFTAPKEIHTLGNVPPGSKAVVIHPKVQERMEQDPAYAQEIFAKIDTWFAFDVARNEAIMAHPPYGSAQKERIRFALYCAAVILRRFLCQGSKQSELWRSAERGTQTAICSNCECKDSPHKARTQTVAYVLVYAPINIAALVAELPHRQGRYVTVVMLHDNTHSFRVAFCCGYDYRVGQQAAFVVIGVTNLCSHRRVPPNSVLTAR